MSFKQKVEAKVSLDVGINAKQITQYLRYLGIPAYIHSNGQIRVHVGELWVDQDPQADQLIYRWFAHE